VKRGKVEAEAIPRDVAIMRESVDLPRYDNRRTTMTFSGIDR
jgi:hypothetical protein